MFGTRKSYDEEEKRHDEEAARDEQENLPRALRNGKWRVIDGRRVFVEDPPLPPEPRPEGRPRVGG